MLCPNCFQEKGKGNVCSSCRYDESQETDIRRLPLRSTLKDRRYVIGRVLGSGGFGITYRAFDSEQYRAIVVIKECLLTDSGQVARADDRQRVIVNSSFRGTYKKCLERFFEEARHISRFQHPNIVRIIDFFYENNTAYYVMPLVDGEDLRTYLEQRGGRLTERELLPIARGLISAVQALHAERIVHRDIKPNNLILTKASGLPVLIDFGAAARGEFGRDDSLSHIGIHTEGYSPIEQVTASPDQGPWTDVYSLSATFYRVLAGKGPVPAHKRFSDGGEDRYAPVEVLTPGISEGLARLINKGLAHDRTQRLQSADEMMRLLPSSKNSEDSTTASPDGLPARREATSPQTPSLDRGRAATSVRHPKQWLWFSPTFLALFGVLGAGNPADYLTQGFLVILILNIAAWAIYTSRFRVHVPDAMSGSTASASLGPDASPLANAVTVGTVRFLDRVTAGRVYLLSPGQRIVIGRRDPADVVIRNQHLSRRHAQVTFLDPDFEILDLGSTNGTFHVRFDDRRVAYQRITRYVGQGTFCLGPHDKNQTRFECSISAKSQ